MPESIVARSSVILSSLEPKLESLRKYESSFSTEARQRLEATIKSTGACMALVEGWHLTPGVSGYLQRGAQAEELQKEIAECQQALSSLLSGGMPLPRTAKEELTHLRTEFMAIKFDVPIEEAQMVYQLRNLYDEVTDKEKVRDEDVIEAKLDVVVRQVLQNVFGKTSLPDEELKLELTCLEKSVESAKASNNLTDAAVLSLALNSMQRLHASQLQDESEAEDEEEEEEEEQVPEDEDEEDPFFMPMPVAALKMAEASKFAMLAQPLGPADAKPFMIELEPGFATSEAARLVGFDSRSSQPGFLESPCLTSQDFEPVPVEAQQQHPESMPSFSAPAAVAAGLVAGVAVSAAVATAATSSGAADAAANGGAAAAPATSAPTTAAPTHATNVPATAATSTAAPTNAFNATAAAANTSATTTAVPSDAAHLPAVALPATWSEAVAAADAADAADAEDTAECSNSASLQSAPSTSEDVWSDPAEVVPEEHAADAAAFADKVDSKAVGVAADAAAAGVKAVVTTAGAKNPKSLKVETYTALASGASAANQLASPGEENQNLFVNFLQRENPGACMFHAQMRLSLEGCQKLSNFLKSSMRVRALSLSHNYLGDEGLAIICEGLMVNQSVTALDLPDNHITDVGIASLVKAIVNSPSLTQLQLSYNRIGDLGAIHLAELIKGSSSLKKLGLSHNNIGKAGCQALTVAISSNQSLKHLQLLPGNPVEEKNAKALAKALKHNKKFSIRSFLGIE